MNNTVSLQATRRLTLGSNSRKFGKHLQKRQLDVPEYAASFVNYKALKKVLMLHQSVRDMMY